MSKIQGIKGILFEKNSDKDGKYYATLCQKKVLFILNTLHEFYFHSSNSESWGVTLARK